MTSHKKINLLEIEDSVAGRVDGLSAHFGRKHIDSRDLGVSLFRYEPDTRAEAGHRHREQEEAYLVVAGHGEMLVDGEVLELRQWDLVRVAPETVRAFAAGPDGMDVVAVGGPKPEGGDGERADVTWPDA
jgi:quercetin dioxygenase-like cupin family protein